MSKKHPFYTALSLCSELYGVDLDPDTFETYAISAWNKIGNKDYKMYRICAKPQCDPCDPGSGWFVCMPCNLDTIEAITLPFEDAAETSSKMNFPGAITHPVEDQIESTKHIKNELYMPGKFVKYKELGDRIYFTEFYPAVNILYKGLYADDDGLPYLNDKEVDAIAAYCAFANDFKKARMTRDQFTLQLSQLQEARWKQLCMLARVPMSISQNEMNEILDAMSSWDRHNYGRTYKPVR